MSNVVIHVFDYVTVQCPALLDKPPHTENLPEPLKPGTCISIIGLIKSECTRSVYILLYVSHY